MSPPLLLVDIDGVISLFGFDHRAAPRRGGSSPVDGIAHFLSAPAGERLLSLSDEFELAWCSGWEEKADEYLPFALGLPSGLPHIALERHRDSDSDGRHWKLRAIDTFAGRQRPLAWIDDDHDPSCDAWARARPAPTLLVTTEPAIGLTAEQTATLSAWARGLPQPR